MPLDWNTYLLASNTVLLSLLLFVQSFNALHQFWINLHQIRSFWNKKFNHEELDQLAEKSWYDNGNSNT